MLQCDVLVIGSGIAGLSCALKVSGALPECSVIVVTKGDISESNTRYAQGGIATVMDKVNDSFSKHIDDTLKAGDGFCNREVVEMVVREGPEFIREMIELGADFDMDPVGDLQLGREGGHTENRIVHHKDITGYELQRILLKRIKSNPNVSILEYHFAIDLITQHHLGKNVNRHSGNIKCFGAYIMDLSCNRIIACTSKLTLLASGGIGQVYKTTTNPEIATGDGIAMAYRAKAIVDKMAFVQFHPTALFNPGESPAFLISEAVRGFGAVLKDINGNEFMSRYDKRGSLASRDIVARAIDREMKAKGSYHIYLDCRHLDIHEFKSRFPNIYSKCVHIGLDIRHDMIPVTPAAHYICGGVVSDRIGRTSIANLYVAGESACTYLHGANRLASNSLLEALVFSHHVYLDLIKKIKSIELQSALPKWNDQGTTQPDELLLITHARKEVQEIMSNYVGIVRSDTRLKRALIRLEILYKETEKLYESSTLSPQLCELRNMINVGYLIITQSMQQKQNKGAFYNIDLISLSFNPD